MKKVALGFLCLSCLGLWTLFAATQTWTDVPLVDQKCSAKLNASTVDTHTKTCALACEASGYGIMTADGTFLKFDKAGSQKALDALKASKKADHLRATVTGDVEGNTIKVQSIKLD
ncbi:MAG TPA: hypothetical protein VML19_19280 [Verrucomicrobiae bacterium]|nr:hypothetical protein [Verrucomicrobiae bacterium]